MDELVLQLEALFKGIWKYRWAAIGVAWGVIMAGWIVVFNLPDNFQSSARVFVDTQSILKPLLAGMTTVPNVDQQVSIMSRTLLSRPNVERVIRMVDLDLKTNSVKDHEKLVDELISQIKISGTSQYDIYTISYSGTNPKLVKDVVQSLLTIFVEGSFGDKKQDSAKAVKFIDEQIRSYEDKLVAAENALKEFKLKNVGLLPRQGSDYGSKLLETMDNLNQAKLELREAEQARDAIRKQIYGEDKGTGAAVPAVTNPDMDARIQALNKNLDALRMQYTEEHPDIVATKRLIAQLEARNREEAKLRKMGTDPGVNASPMLQQLKVSLAEAEAKVASMRARVEEYVLRASRLKEMSIAMPEVETQLAQLNRDYMINKENYEKLVASRESAKLSGELSATTEMMTFRVIDPPTVPLTPTGPNRPRLISLVFVVGIMAGVGLALLLSKIRPTFHSPASLGEITSLPILGSVSMNWTEQEKSRQRRSMYAFAISSVFSLLLFGGVLSFALLKT